MIILSVFFCRSMKAEIKNTTSQTDPRMEYPALNPTDANIIGHITDKKTGEHLPFIKVFIAGTTIGTTTDATGHYFLKNLPEGQFTLVMQAMGFKTSHWSCRPWDSKR